MRILFLILCAAFSQEILSLHPGAIQTGQLTGNSQVYNFSANYTTSEDHDCIMARLNSQGISQLQFAFDSPEFDNVQPQNTTEITSSIFMIQLTDQEELLDFYIYMNCDEVCDFSLEIDMSSCIVPLETKLSPHIIVDNESNMRGIPTLSEPVELEYTAVNFKPYRIDEEVIFEDGMQITSVCHDDNQVANWIVASSVPRFSFQILILIVMQMPKSANSAQPVILEDSIPVDETLDESEYKYYNYVLKDFYSNLRIRTESAEQLQIFVSTTPQPSINNYAFKNLQSSNQLIIFREQLLQVCEENVNWNLYIGVTSTKQSSYSIELRVKEVEVQQLTENETFQDSISANHDLSYKQYYVEVSTDCKSCISVQQIDSAKKFDRWILFASIQEDFVNSGNFTWPGFNEDIQPFEDFYDNSRIICLLPDDLKSADPTSDSATIAILLLADFDASSDEFKFEIDVKSYDSNREFLESDHSIIRSIDDEAQGYIFECDSDNSLIYIYVQIYMHDLSSLTEPQSLTVYISKYSDSPSVDNYYWSFEFTTHKIYTLPYGADQDYIVISPSDEFFTQGESMIGQYSLNVQSESEMFYTLQMSIQPVIYPILVPGEPIEGEVKQGEEQYYRIYNYKQQDLYAAIKPQNGVLSAFFLTYHNYGLQHNIMQATHENFSISMPNKTDSSKDIILYSTTEDFCVYCEIFVTIRSESENAAYTIEIMYPPSTGVTLSAYVPYVESFVNSQQLYSYESQGGAPSRIMIEDFEKTSAALSYYWVAVDQRYDPSQPPALMREKHQEDIIGIQISEEMTQLFDNNFEIFIENQESAYSILVQDPCDTMRIEHGNYYKLVGIDSFVYDPRIEVMEQENMVECYVLTEGAPLNIYVSFSPRDSFIVWPTMDTFDVMFLNSEFENDLSMFLPFNSTGTFTFLVDQFPKAEDISLLEFSIICRDTQDVQQKTGVLTTITEKVSSRSYQVGIGLFAVFLVIICCMCCYRNQKNSQRLLNDSEEVPEPIADLVLDPGSYPESIASSSNARGGTYNELWE